MDRKKVIPVVMVVAILTMMSAVVIPVSAYTVIGNPQTEVVQLYFEDDEAWSLFLWPGYATDVVIYEAQLKGIEVQRSESTIDTEISGHAAAWLFTYWWKDRANPMDIEMYDAAWWTYFD